MVVDELNGHHFLHYSGSPETCRMREVYCGMCISWDTADPVFRIMPDWKRGFPGIMLPNKTYREIALMVNAMGGNWELSVRPCLIRDGIEYFEGDRVRMFRKVYPMTGVDGFGRDMPLQPYPQPQPSSPQEEVIEGVIVFDVSRGEYRLNGRNLYEGERLEKCH